MHNQALKKDTINAISIGAQAIAMVVVASSKLIRLEAARIIGMDIKNEKRAAASRVYPSIKAAVMVIPEREVPGNKAKA